MLDLVIVDGRLEVSSHVTWLLVKSKDILLMRSNASGGWKRVFLSTNAMGTTLRQLGKYTRKGFFKSLLHKFHPTCIPVSGDHQSN
jgi:hypothetical protein